MDVLLDGGVYFKIIADGPVYAQFSVGAYLPEPTGVRAPWRAVCRILSYFCLLF